MKLSIKAWLALLAIGAILFIGLGATTIVGWEYSNSSAFCSEACHTAHPEEPPECRRGISAEGQTSLTVIAHLVTRGSLYNYRSDRWVYPLLSVFDGSLGIVREKRPPPWKQLAKIHLLALPRPS